MLLDAHADTKIRTMASKSAAGLALQQFMFNGKNPVHKEIAEMIEAHEKADL